ncbi:adenylate/guanylate cyclase domain-containing protein [Spirillospora sp. NBC_01491]|uniref:adenylate/guanylate cyclase domain-containing protein n=1 Tax=Spirillospora sp. NBC_01491 TaxID=2976007 RepID=UPI002E2EF549|nr:adenylate/guanylate cyclase domain-containing protein [Spirillospora sp. NBC_01491]
MSGRAVARNLGARLDQLPGVPRTMLEVRVRWVLLVVVVVANLTGSLVVLLFATFVVPDPPLDDRGHVHLVNAIAFFSYPIAAGPVALALGLRLWRPVVRLVREGGIPDRGQGRAVLLGPLRLTLLVGALWAVGAVGWAALDLTLFTARLAVKTGLTCLLGAMTTSTIVYLLSERLLRPAAALVLASDQPRRIRLPGVTTRVMLAWALGTAIPVFGLICVAIAALAAPGIQTTQLAITVLGLGGAALVVGVQVTYMATRAIADPIKSVRTGMARVERGDLGAEVAVYDASEVGQLQAGFNHMVAGLRDHARLRDLFGRHVGEPVAGLALEHGDITLGGETREVAVLFVDLTGSTTLAETRSPDEVVGLLNAFFGVVVNMVGRHGGWINKFEGDAALAIFGAPTELEDPAGAVLGAARELALRLRAEVPMLDAGIGVSAGPVVAGYIGAEQRFEYTVIGDPVNEAARLSDLAKGAPGRVLASSTVLDLAHLAEVEEWDLGKSVTLRGRKRQTRLAVPRPPTDAEPVPVPGDDPSTRRIRLPRPLARRRRRGARRLLVGALMLSRAAKGTRPADAVADSGDADHDLTDPKAAGSGSPG